jgi:hypothetical protein
MNQLDDHTRRALCAADQPPPGAEDRVLAAILGPTGAGPPDGGSGPAADGGQWTLGYAAKVVGATIGLTAGGLALVAITAAGIREDRAPRQPHTVIETPAELEVRTTDEREPAAEAAPILDAPDPASTPPAPVKPEPSGRTSPLQTPGPTPTIEAELALMKVARGSDDPSQALAALEQHRREFASGVLAAEREVLRVETLCALGQSTRAKAVAAEFIADYPGHPLRSRVEPTCRK